MKVPHKITKLTPEQAYIYGFLEGRMLDEPIAEPVIERDSKATYYSNSKDTNVVISEMHDSHLLNTYKKMMKENISSTMIGTQLLAEIKYRDLADTL